MTRKPFFPIVLIFVILSLLLVVLNFSFSKWSATFNAVLGGNLVLFIATYFSFQFYNKGLRDPNIQVFLRTVYSAMLLKMGICIAAVVAYAFIVKPVSKAAVLVFFGLYFIYTFAEVKIVTRLNKQNKNA
jgi:amino acid transporter